MVKAIHLACHTAARPFEWIKAPANAPDINDLIMFQNGILDIATGDLLEYTGDYFATATPVVDFDPNATCPLFMAKLHEWLHPSFHPTLQEFFGYCLTSDTRHHAILAMIGAPRGGKGTLTRVLETLVGRDHYKSLGMNDLGSDYGLEGATDKRVIIIPDAADATKRSTALERLKSISGGDPVGVNRKFLKIVTALIRAKIVMVANRHPKFLDESGALAAREIVIRFERSFADRPDPDLQSKLAVEVSGIANWALEGLRRLRANGKFTIGAKGREASRDLEEDQSPALRFAKAHIIITRDEADFVSLDDVFLVYEQWATEESLASGERRNRNDLKGDLVAALGPRGLSHRQKRRGKGDRRRGFYGVRLRPVARAQD